MAQAPYTVMIAHYTLPEIGYRAKIVFLDLALPELACIALPRGPWTYKSNQGDGEGANEDTKRYSRAALLREYLDIKP